MGDLLSSHARWSACRACFEQQLSVCPPAAIQQHMVAFMRLLSVVINNEQQRAMVFDQIIEWVSTLHRQAGFVAERARLIVRLTVLFVLSCSGRAPSPHRRRRFAATVV
jgi:hypothetical protein